MLYTKVVHPDDLERVAGEVAKYSVGKEQKRFTHEPYRIVTKDGKIKWINDRTDIRRDEILQRFVWMLYWMQQGF
ncbi:MAG: PAS domain-containing protein [Desulfobacula sp.]|nr:PAS domain-containing protein [Desulfobacula sp.]MCD4720121.1 PAS domain-containing protein [Desulfobacula sp.]